MPEKMLESAFRKSGSYRSFSEYLVGGGCAPEAVDYVYGLCQNGDFKRAAQAAGFNGWG